MVGDAAPGGLTRVVTSQQRGLNSHTTVDTQQFKISPCAPRLPLTTSHGCPRFHAADLFPALGVALTVKVEAPCPARPTPHTGKEPLHTLGKVHTASAQLLTWRMTTTEATLRCCSHPSGLACGWP